MKGLPCEVVRDLLPLYVEEAVEPKTRELVVEHLGECSSCSELLAGLQEDEPDLSQIEEKIPEPDTFRKWHKRFRQGILGLAIVLIIGVIGVGFASYKAGTLAAQDKYSTHEVVKVLEKGGLQLKKSRKPFVAPQEALIGNIRPKVYEAYEDLCQIYIYEFPSTLERRKAMEEIDKIQEQGESHPFSFEEMNKKYIAIRNYSSKNMIITIVYQLTEDNYTEELERVNHVAPALGKAVFFQLNGGTQYVYYGEGENWEAKYLASCYEESWLDEKGYRRTEYLFVGIPSVRYKGNPEEVHDYSTAFNYHNGSQGQTGTGGFRQGNMDDDQLNAFGGSYLLGGNGFNPKYFYKDAACSFEAQWNGDKEEEFELELIKTRTVENAYEE